MNKRRCDLFFNTDHVWMINWVGDQINNWMNICIDWLADWKRKSVSDRVNERMKYVHEKNTLRDWMSEWLIGPVV
jgi:hypothetical protein